jgi:hypothetical protein
MLVDYVGGNHVCGNERDDAVDQWCARWIRELERVDNDRSPICGQPNTPTGALAMSQAETELAPLRTMTVGQLLDMFKDLDPTPEHWEAIVKVLGVILSHAVGFYDNCDDLIGRYALILGLSVVKANGIDKDTAANMVENMGVLAHTMLNADGQEKEWSPDTVARLRVIRDTNPEVAKNAASDAAE